MKMLPEIRKRALLSKTLMRRSWHRFLSRTVKARYFISFFGMGLFFGALSVAILSTAFHAMSPGPFVLAVIALGLALGVVGCYVLCYWTSTALFGDRMSLQQLEESFLRAKQSEQIELLPRIIDAHMTANHIETARFFSDRLMELLEPSNTSRGLLSKEPWTLTTDAWISTPGYNKRPLDRLIMMYLAKGHLSLSPNDLCFKSDEFSVDVPLGDIVSIKLGHHPRWYTLVSQAYIVVRFQRFDGEHEIYLNPCLQLLDPPQLLDKLAKKWYDHIEFAKRNFEVRLAKQFGQSA